MKISPLTTSFINPNRKKNHVFTSIPFGASEKALEEAKKVFSEYDVWHNVDFQHTHLDDDELNVISEFIKENPQCINYYGINLERTNFENASNKENFMTLTYSLLSDDEKLDIFSKMSATLNRFLLTPASILAILEQDPKVTSTFFNELLYRQNEKADSFNIVIF